MSEETSEDFAESTSFTHRLFYILEDDSSEVWSSLFQAEMWKAPFKRFRLLVLENDFNTFHSVLRRLRALGCREIPAVAMEEEDDFTQYIPSNPANSWLSSSADPLADALRSRWKEILDGSSFLPDRDAIFKSAKPFPTVGEVESVELGVAATTFAAGMNAAISATASSGGLVDFVVHSRNTGWRLHSTERYWFSPVIFGTKLSTPVHGSLSPSDYRFGGDKGSKIVWDKGTYPVSSSHTSTRITRF